MVLSYPEFERRLGELSRGDHVCMVYENPVERMAATVPFFLQGLAANDCCLYIADDRAVDEMVMALSEQGVDIRHEQARGALNTFTHCAALLKEGRFEPAEIVESLAQLTAHAMRDGFRGLRVVGEMTWALGWDRLLEYETLLNRFFPNHRALAICQYDRHQFSPSMIREVLRSHPQVIVGKHVCTNLFYEPPELLLDRCNDSERVDWMLRQLRLNEDTLASSRRADEVQARLAAIVESSQDAIVSKTLDGIISSWNAGAERLFGYSPEEAVGKSITILIPPELLDEERLILEQLRRGERVEHFETVRVTKDGRRLHISLSISPIRGRDGQIVGASKVARDITARKVADAALRESEKRFRALVTATSDVIYRMNPDWSEMRQFDGRDLFTDTPSLSRSWLETYIPPEERPRLAEVIAEAVHAKKVFELEHRVLRNDGTEGWTFSRAIPVLDDCGNITEWFGSASDVTRRKQAEEALTRVIAESERRKRLYETILSNTPDLAYVFDLNHRFTYANEVLLQMWGKTWDEAIGKNCLELGYEPWHAEMHDREIELVVATKKAIRGEVPFAGTFGRRIYDYIFVPVFNAAGEVEAVAGTTRDVTERKAMEEELRESDRRKGEFIALLAHELRNPLAPIRNGLQVLKLAEGDPEPLARARGMMDRQLSHMVRLIDDLLDVSRINRNKMELRKSKVALAEVLASAIETARPLIDDAGLELNVSLPSREVYLDGDLTRLAQVFANLLTNSSKYTPQGGRIWITAERKRHDVTITVRDTGIGIPANSLPTIFDMFSQIDRSIERTTGGLGIGLALVKGLVELHGGTVTANSMGEGLGSTFTIHLPVLEDRVTANDVASADPTPEISTSCRVLVVDDNRDGADSLAEMLRLLGNDVRTANDGIEAIAVAEAFHPQLILMDVGMPRMNGLDACRKIRSEPWGRRVTIVALTGWGQEHDRERSRAAGCDGHLVKPIDLPDLERLLVEVGNSSGASSSI
jgi:PAS domain S-box-containing protein